MSSSLISPVSTHAQTFCPRSLGFTRLLCKAHRRSRMIATAATEHRMIGHMKPPPALMISHIRPSSVRFDLNEHDT